LHGRPRIPGRPLHRAYEVGEILEHEAVLIRRVPLDPRRDRRTRNRTGGTQGQGAVDMLRTPDAEPE
jgi:hypothetical protein